ncbi:hypothetical protein NLM33_25095 [Bradyrhizobium sp. CCGUVB1N3]|uniref:hypothetical protein n=1 Tax=Bradyrhizobium sp. CCGUVB1N3 TaxID=2949629 RepID=UPI0020B39387|nr:hypothetical protein [Bradyrhizobium sp. CCGUVB1N3]MCP3471813.1 hypothetical protein [Bradyrhizobium sp. CCGUVB1N3]MCP3473595.1 hypothetical protein [Bradyrhizobium sp. CCGUVB1N3]
MSGVVGNWRVELVERYRDLFHPPAGAPMSAQGSPECGSGWRDLLDRMCVRIRAAVRPDGGAFRFTQIKSKYGTLRVYWDGTLSPDAAALVEEAIALAEARSACSCEICGEEGRLYEGAWLTTRCTTHAEGRSPVAVRPGFENIYIVRYVVGGKSRITCRRYDRENDAFVDVDPASLDIEEE